MPSYPPLHVGHGDADYFVIVCQFGVDVVSLSQQIDFLFSNFANRFQSLNVTSGPIGISSIVCRPRPPGFYSIQPYEAGPIVWLSCDWFPFPGAHCSCDPLSLHRKQAFHHVFEKEGARINSSVRPSVCPSVWSVCQSVCLSVCLSVHALGVLSGKWHTPNRFGQLFFKIMSPVCYYVTLLKSYIRFYMQRLLKQQQHDNQLLAKKMYPGGDLNRGPISCS